MGAWIIFAEGGNAIADADDEDSARRILAELADEDPENASAFYGMCFRDGVVVKSLAAPGGEPARPGD